MSLIPGLGIAKGMAVTLRRLFEPKVTVKYPEDRRDPPHKFRGRLQLLYDEWGTLKCETCFQCAQACPIECIDMGGIDTRGRYHVHWGAPETYGERREESALRRSGRTVPGSRLPAVRRDRPGRARRDPRRVRPRPGAHAPDPGGDPGGLRLPAGRRAQADQPADRGLVRDDLRHGELLHATCGSSPPTATAQAAAIDRPPTVRGDLPERARTRSLAGGAGRRHAGAERPTDGRALKTPRRLADDPARAGRRGRSDRPRRGGPRRRVRRAAPRDPRPRRRPGRSRRSRRPGCAAVAAPASRPPTSGGLAAGDRGAAALRRGQRLRRGPGRRHGPLPPRARPVRGRRGRRDRRLRDRRHRGDHRRPGRGDRGDPAARGGHRRRRGGGLPRLRRARLRPRPRRCRSGRVQGAYMLGEETVLLKALEGKRGQPEQRPPHPAERGLLRHADGRPQRPDPGGRARGSSATARRRSPRSAPRTAPGRSSSRSGRRPATGSRRSRSGRRCARSSRSAGSCPRAARSRPSSSADRPAACCRRTCSTRRTTFEALREAGAHVGSGSVVVADDRACVVDLARLLTRFCASEACGKTIPCRIGTRRLVEIADRVVDGRPRPTDLTLLTDLSADIVGLRAVRPRAPDDPSARERDAILPVRAGRAHPPQLLPSRRLPPDRGGRRRDLIRRPWPT